MQRLILSVAHHLSLSPIAACFYVITGIICADSLPELLPIWVVSISLCITIIMYFAVLLVQARQITIYAICSILMLLLGGAATYFEIYRQPHQMLAETGHFDFDAVIEYSEWRAEGRVRAIVKPLTNKASSSRQKQTEPSLTDFGLIRVTMRLDRLPEPGDIATIFARLFPLSGPFLPDMPDYGRAAYSQKIGASGFAYQVELHHQKDVMTMSRAIQSLRSGLDLYFQNRLHPIAASIASSVYLGKRDGLPPDIYIVFQKSGLAHLLAISGLHMALFCLSLFGVLRLCLLPAESVIPVSAHKIAAMLAVLAGFAYLIISDMPVSAIRAWAIAAIVLTAIMIDRRALTLRTLALVAILMLLWKPSYLYQPAFQLSFSATFGIVAIHQLLRRRLPRAGISGFVLNLAVTSLAAGTITTPFIAYHFALFTPYALLSNLFAVPLMGLLMPLGLLAIAFEATGLTIGLLRLYEFGIFSLIEIAHLFSALPAAGIWIKPPDFYLLGIWMLSIACLLSTAIPARWFGLIGLGLFLSLWIRTPITDFIQIQIRNKPVLIVNGDHNIVTTDNISEFWYNIVARRMGKKPLSICQTSICEVSVKSQTIYLIGNRKGITEACKDTARPSISVYKPKYHCAAASQFLFIKKEQSNALYHIDLNANVPELHIKLVRPVSRPWRAAIASE